MAINDDPDWLLDHIKHSFITSDDTGMCEMVIIHDYDVKHIEDIRLYLKHRRDEKATKFKNQTARPSSFKDKSQALNGSDFSPNLSNASPGPFSPSPDIPTGWDFGVRRRSNTAQKLDRIKRERQNRIKVKKIPWRDRPGGNMTKEEMAEMFGKKLLSSRQATTDGAVNEVDINSPNIPSNPDPVCHGFNVPRNETNLVDTIREQLANNNKPKLEKIIESCKIITNHKDEEKILNEFEMHLKNDEIKNSAYKAIKPGDLINETKTETKNSSSHFKSLLSKQLLEGEGRVKNPFKEYARFNGKGQEGTAPTKKINIFVWADASKKPKFSSVIDVVVLTQNAKIQDLIGLTCWLYSSRDEEPKLQSKSVKDYSLHIAEDDGSVDADFPALESQKPVDKFGFKTLTMVQKQRILRGENCTDAKEAIFVKETFSGKKAMGTLIGGRSPTPRKAMDYLVFCNSFPKKVWELVHSQKGTGMGTPFPLKMSSAATVNDHDGSSVIMVEDLNVLMGDILKKALKKRKGNKYPERYHLEYQNKHGTVIKEDETLESTGVMEFFLCRQHSSRNENGNGTLVENISTSLPASLPISKDYLFNEYKRFRLFHIQKLRSTEVSVGVGATQIDIDPVTVKESKLTLLLSPRLKPLSISIYSIAHCEMVIDAKPASAASSSFSISPSSSSGGDSLGVTSSMTSFSSQIMNSSNEKGVFKLYYKLPDLRSDFKHITLEGTRQVVSDAVDYIKQIMILNGNLELQSSFKASKLGVESTSTITRRKSRRGTLFHK